MPWQILDQHLACFVSDIAKDSIETIFECLISVAARLEIELTTVIFLDHICARIVARLDQTLLRFIERCEGSDISNTD